MVNTAAEHWHKNLLSNRSRKHGKHGKSATTIERINHLGYNSTWVFVP